MMTLSSKAGNNETSCPFMKPTPQNSSLSQFMGLPFNLTLPKLDNITLPKLDGVWDDIRHLKISMPQSITNYL
jgi:hypothetical protein